MKLTPEQIAIREAVAEVFAKLGVEAFRKLAFVVPVRTQGKGKPPC